ncbi:hypothetical protein B0F90DRAFT_1744031 [Multifurca ochricompacta]|uniref:Uncharacterized protein n=1 Tax=Multifurca ochricompacta TaxID=376703 RepID=A0AAD4QLJ5_9AGAM|nr:hypothetical protein B0F90DRAFT_1744031 [Multifurca ochricompacta]
MVEKYKLMRHIKPQHELTYASSDVMETMTRRSRTRGTCFSWVLVSFIPGLGNFRGRVFHSGQWDVTEEGEWEEGVKYEGLEG